MPKNEHLLTIVEPTTGGETTLDFAHQTVARGGTASVLLVITDRVQRDIRAFAAAAELGYGEAEVQALDQLATHCSERVGGAPRLETHFGSIGSELVKYVTADTTAIAIPAHMATDRLVERVVAYSGRPVIVAPGRLAAA